MANAALDDEIRGMLGYYLQQIELHLDCSAISIYGPIQYGLETCVKQAIENIGADRKKDTLLVILDTTGGSAEVVERIVNILRHHFKTVNFLVYNKAMSAGTILVMSGNRIYMNYYSVLGPIDPQVIKDGRWVPALSYLRQYDILNQKGKAISTAEAIMLQKMDPGELYQFERARDLSVTLLKKWLSQYKFSDWDITETTKRTVDRDMKIQRAQEIADKLSEIDTWHTHSRPINMETLNTELKLKIDNYDDDGELRDRTARFVALADDYATQKGWSTLIFTREYYHYDK